MQVNPIIAGIALVITTIVGLVIGYHYRKKIAEGKIASAEEAASHIVEDAKKQAEELKRETLLEAKEEVHRLRTDLEKENRERRSEIQRSERRIQNKEEALDKKIDSLENRETSIQNKEQDVQHIKEKTEKLFQKQVDELERISELTREQARTLLLESLDKEISHETAVKIREYENRAKEEADKKSREIISLAIQKSAAEHVAETTVSVVELPNDDMKGRIIGREGRNIRALETATGIDLIIDDTPEAVILSGFDPVRREIARIALEKLILDGRIHPTRIEEMVNKAKKEVDRQLKEDGEQAMFDSGLHGIHPEIIKLIGRLKFRTSYGQNVLRHSMEVCNLAGVMAAEIGANIKLAKRAGLLHDIGKAVDHEIEGTHAEIGADIAKKFREQPLVINAIAAHHGDCEANTIEAVLVQAADAVSAARPGARRETLETYIKRLEKLEEIADAFNGVDKSFAIQAGRELRIIVKPEKITDDEAMIMARDIVKRVETELEYPGQIKINVIRETRAIEYAK
jgi:ribonuclease Y